MYNVLFYSLMILSAIGWFVFAFLVFWYWQREQRERTRIRQTKADIADIMLLFSTMRDVVAQQKQLASDFNEELERKVGGVKQILAAAIDKNERLYERQRELERELSGTRAELESLQRQLAYTNPAGARTETTPRSARPNVLPRPRPAAPAPAPVQETLPADAEAPFVALPGESTPAPDAPPVPEEPLFEVPGPEPAAGATLWEQVDLAALADNSILGADIEEDLEEEEQLAPADADAARDAFRALLDLSSRTATDEVEKPNGRNNRVNVALQQRIVQYAEAGMAVSEIARELGIGKGEVRLLLSLAKPGQT